MKALSPPIFLAIVSLLVASSSCSDSDESESDEQPSNTIVATAGGGHGAEPYESPVVRAEGDWIPPAFVPFTQEAIREDWDRIQGAPLIRGDARINGFRFYRGGDSEYQQVAPLCDMSTAPLNVMASESDFPFTVGYLPPATVEEVHPKIRHCKERTLLAAVRTFANGPASLYVSFIAGEKAIDFLPFEEKVKPIRIHGEDGVAVEPMIYGSGPSIIAWPYENGYIRIDGNSLPYDEVLKVADGVVTK